MDKLKRQRQTRQCEDITLGALSHSGLPFLAPPSLPQQILMHISTQGQFNHAQFSSSAVKTNDRGERVQEDGDSP